MTFSIMRSAASSVSSPLLVNAARSSSFKPARSQTVVRRSSTDFLKKPGRRELVTGMAAITRVLIFYFFGWVLCSAVSPGAQRQRKPLCRLAQEVMRELWQLVHTTLAMSVACFCRLGAGRKLLKTRFETRTRKRQDPYVPAPTRSKALQAARMRSWGLSGPDKFSHLLLCEALLEINHTAISGGCPNITNAASQRAPTREHNQHQR